MPDLHEPSTQRAWHVVRTHPRQELRAEQNLLSGGIESFLPRMRAPRARRRAGSVPAAALFPQYLFARFDPHVRLHDVSFTRGVQSVVQVGGSLALVDEAVIAVLRSRVDATGLIRIGEPLQPGEKVVIADGPFAALVGVVERVLPEKERVTLLLTAVHASVRIDLDAESVRRVSSAA